MKKIKLKEYAINIIFILILIMFFSSVILARPISDLDELWNYSFARNIADGLVPYKDFNMVTTPLTPFICSIFISIIDELIIMRILAILLLTAIMFLIHKIFIELKINKYIGFAIIAAIIWLMKKYICVDYNYLALFIALIIILKELKEYKKFGNVLMVNRKMELVIGILVGLAIITKQSTGLAIAVVCIGYKLLEVRNIEEFKKFIKIIALRFGGILIPISILFLYLIITGALSDFIDYTILGIPTFKNKISYLLLVKSEDITYKILSISAPIIMLITFLKGVITKDVRAMVLSGYAFAGFAVVFPISNNAHFVVGVVIAVICLIYLLSCLCKYIKFVKIKKAIIIIFQVGIIALLIMVAVNSTKELKKYIEAVPEYEKINHFKYINIAKWLKDDINQIEKYVLSMEGMKVYIIDAQAVVYHIPMDVYYKDYDLFLIGNLGSGGVQKQIEKLQNEKDVIILIKQNNYNWQIPIDAINYIKNNWTNTGNIGMFGIYEIERQKL